MKRIIIYLLDILVLLACSACTDDTEFDAVSPHTDAYGELTLTFEELLGKEYHHTSRAVHDKEDEEFLQSLRVYTFNETGALTGYVVQRGVNGNSLSTPKGRVTLKTRGGRAYIYAIANLNNSQYPVSIEDFNLLNVNPDAVSLSKLTRDRFLNIRFNRQRKALLPLDNHFLMSGSVNSGRLVTLVPSTSGRLTIAQPVSDEDRIIKLHRVVAKNKISIQAKNGCQFTLSEVQLCNVALHGRVMPYAPNEQVTTDSEVEQMDAVHITSKNIIEFYLPENLQMAGSDKLIQDWKDRETDQYDATFTQRTFVNAPEKSSYIILRGSFRDDENHLAAEVAYTIHFGDFGGKSGDLYNYRVERNNLYTYNITVNGVDDIIVEAEKQDNNPYAEGNIIHIKKGIIYQLDAHYESRILKFVKGGIHDMQTSDENQSYNGYIAYISTIRGTTKSICVEQSEQDGKVYLYDVFEKRKHPMCEIRQDGAFYDLQTGNKITESADLKNILGSLDYKWAKFRRNTSANLDGNKKELNKYVCKYPGDQYFEKPSFTMNTRITGDQEQLISIFGLLYNLAVHDGDKDNRFWNAMDEEGNPCVYYTTFVDENYYEDLNWSEYVNQPNRVMHVASEIFISEDTHSTYTTVLYTLFQRSIKTFYNPNMASRVNAYGIESVTEEQNPVSGNPEDVVNYDQMYYDFQERNQHSWNGFTCSSSVLANESWGRQNNVYVPGQQALHQTVSAAALTRNRDLNGNGVIDKDEVRWYVGTIGQYNGIWFGEDILPAEARLFDINQMHQFKNADPCHEYHYFTVSHNYEIFWAEEGSSTSTLTNGKWSQARQVRCFRTLQSNGKGLCDPDTYYETKSLQTGEVEVSLERMDRRALRTAVNTYLGIHFERDEQNRLPVKFKIANKLARNRKDNTIGFLWEEVKNYRDQDNIITGYAGYGWRVPNQRELSLMALIDTDAKYRNIWCRTKFNGVRYGDNGRGYKKQISGYGRLQNGNITVGITGKMNVYCVKDMP